MLIHSALHVPPLLRPASIERGGSFSSINASNARERLSELVRRPLSENNYRERLACMLADPAISSWQALTRDPQRLQRLQDNERKGWSDPAAVDKSLPTLAQALAGKDLWLPEAENFNANILKNLTTQMAEKYLVQFRSILQDPVPVRAQDVSIVRGAPSAGKTTFLKGQFALNTDAVKNMLQDRMPGAGMMQVHDQAVALVQRFSATMEKHLAQPLTRDALYLWPSDFKPKIVGVEQISTEPKLRFHDIQVDLTTLCCRILKRGTDEAVMNFDVLSQFFSAGLEHRNQSIDSIKGTKGVLKEYSLSAWDGQRNVLVAQRARDSQSFVVRDQALFDNVTTRDKDSISAEISRVRDTLIDAHFIDTFTAPLPVEHASAFRAALGIYRGLTLQQALEQHAQRKPVVTSIASRVLAQVVPN
ncbi:hypothetical protein QF045_002285 [Pseudomonas sp. W4I3]|nr:hypothetical protein [Pseudomonas sp. W4I3]